MHIRDVSFDLFWDLRRCNTRISLCLPLLLHTHTYTRARAYARMCVLHIRVNHPRAPRTSRYRTRSTFVELWPGNDDGAAVLCLAFDNRSTRYVHTAHHRRRWTGGRNADSAFWQRSVRCHPRAICFAILMITSAAFLDKVYPKL